MHVAGAEAGLATGLMTVWSGMVWGSAEWGVPWDWTDVRLNTFGLLTFLALFLILGRQSQPDGVESRDTFSTFGLFGFVLVPVTYVATRLWQIRHRAQLSEVEKAKFERRDGPNFVSRGDIVHNFIIGHILMSMRITSFEQRLESIQKQWMRCDHGRGNDVSCCSLPRYAHRHRLMDMDYFLEKQ